MNDFLHFSLIYGGVVLVISLLFGTPIVILDYYSSCREAGIYNQQNETNYTCSDFFWASSQINSQSQIIKLK